MEQYLSDQNQLHIFDNDNFSISCKNADLSAVDNFFDNIAHPYQATITSFSSTGEVTLAPHQLSPLQLLLVGWTTLLGEIKNHVL